MQLNDAAGIHEITMRRCADNHCVADGHHHKELLYALSIWSQIRTCSDAIETRQIIDERLIGQQRWRRCTWFCIKLLQLRRRMIIVCSINHTTSKEHLILSQCAGFVREDVLYLTEFLGYVHGTTFRLLVCVRIIQINVVVYMKHLQYLA